MNDTDPKIFPNEYEKISLMVCQQGDVALHKHDFLEMVYVTEGKAIHTLNGAKTIVKKGDYFIIDYNAYHQYNNIGNIKFNIINTLFKPEIIDKTLFRCRSFQDLINHYLIRFSYKTLENNPTNFIFHDDDLSIYTIIQKMQIEFEKKSAGYIELMRCYLIEIIIKTMRRISKPNADVSFNDHSRYIIEYVEENYMKPITLTQISKNLNFSLPYICKKFKSDMGGVSFQEYLQKKRVEQSCRLLTNTDKKIAEIAELVGYNDVKFFNLVFKKHLRMSPREFKNLHNG